jgi:glycine C-acetyltransferase
MANIGLISAIGHRDDVIFSDERNHASIIDECELSNAEIVIYPHRNVEQPGKLVNEYRHANSNFIITDGVFSMVETIVPLPELLRLAEDFDAHVVVDDANSLGVLGEHDHGILEHFGTKSHPRIVHVRTCSKILGSLGVLSMTVQHLFNIYANVHNLSCVQRCPWHRY